MAPRADALGEVEFLLLCMECVDSGVKWDEVAVKTGRFKGAATARQFYKRMKEKYKDSLPQLAVGSGNGTKSTGVDKAGKKRVAADAAESKGKHEAPAKRQKKAVQKRPKSEATDDESPPADPTGKDKVKTEQ